MGSESATVSVCAAGDMEQSHSHNNGVVNVDATAADNAETTRVLSNGGNVSAKEIESACEPQTASAGDSGSDWLNPPIEGNGSGWISADGSPVTLPVTVPSAQPWSSSKQRTLYLVRVPRSADEKLSKEIKLAEAKLEQTIRKRDAQKAAWQAKKNSKMELLEKFRPVRERERACREALQGKRMELEPVSVALDRFRTAHNKGQDLCASEEELNDKISEIQFRIQHESIPLKEEKQLLREIKQLESTRSQVCANSALQAELMENLGPREDFQDQAKFLRQDLDSLRKEHKLARAEYNVIDEEIKKLNEVIEELRQQYEKANAAQQDAYAMLRELKRQENLKNDPFYQNKRDVQAARELAAQRKLTDVEDFCTKQVEDFMGTWNQDAKFRAEYTKSNERSTVRRLETLDGRSLGPNEKPPIINDAGAAPSKSQDVKLPVLSDGPLPSGSLKTAKPSAEGHETSDGVVANKTSLHAKQLPALRKEEVGAVERGILEEESVDSDLLAAELKEKLRQEQIAKAKEAEERKRRRSEKVESRALARAKKEAERKEKEREKKALKKGGGSSSPSVDTMNLNEEPTLVETKQPSSEPAEAVAQDGSKSTSNASVKSKRGAVARGRLPGREVKMARSMLSKRVSKKVAWPIPLWAMASMALLLLLVALVLYMRL